MAKIFEYKDSILGIIHKNKRRIIANFRQNQIRRIKSIILILIFCVSNVFAVENSNINYGEYTLDWYKYEYMYVTYHGVMQPVYEYFYKDSGKFPMQKPLLKQMLESDLKEYKLDFNF